MNKFIYLDAAATALKPESVIAKQTDFLRNHYANSGRGVCGRAIDVDNMLMNARKSVADFIGADAKQIVFTSGTTDAMNRICRIVTHEKQSGFVVAVSDLDHHSTRMPWEAVAKDGSVKLIKLKLDSDFNIDVANIPVCDVLVITAMSNVLGNVQSVDKIIKIAREKNPDVVTIVDAAQYVVHCVVDVKNMDCDFLCFSGHKIGADTGVGIMYVKNPDRWFPDKFGGGMISRIFGDFSDNDSNWLFSDGVDKFEAGTLPLTQIIALPDAIDNLKKWSGGQDLIWRLYDGLCENNKIRILTSRDSKLFTFIVNDMNVFDFGTIIGAHGVCLRVGNMCATWIHNLLNVSGSIRISVGPWNTESDIDDVIQIIKNVVLK